MFTNQRILAAVLIIFIVGAATYFTISKFKQEVSNTSSSPSPSPSALTFIFQTPQPAPNQSVAVSGQTQVKQGPQKPSVGPQSQDLPLSKVKRLSSFPGILKDEIRQNKAAVIETAKGKIIIQIFPEVPQTSSNFLLLASNGFYDGLTFHRIEPNFVVQGGDPNGDGTGGPGYTFADEPVLTDYKKGIVAMANAGPNTNGSQFFILLENHPELPKKYTIFGYVISGMDVVENLRVGDVIQKAVIQNLQ